MDPIPVLSSSVVVCGRLWFLKEGKKVMWNKQSDDLVNFLRNVTIVEAK
jgi:hypothetical protein